MQELVIIGGGLAGCEAAWQAAERNVKVVLFEMRPHISTGAHTTGSLSELVCSNSLGSTLTNKATGLLNEELTRMGSLLIESAKKSSVPAGSALAVDRMVFSQIVTDKISSHPNIRVIREEVREIPSGPAIIASGPLTSETLASEIARLTGENRLFFYDAIAPIVKLETINMEIAFQGSRYNKGVTEDGDYINCPFTKEEYKIFVNELLNAEKIQLKDFEKEIQDGVNAGDNRYFEGCLPIEILASRGESSLAFGPLRPVGLIDPHTNKRPYAVLQLRQDNLAGSLFNMVGFQTNLTHPEQRRVFKLIPGLEKAEFVRFGQMHKNTFIASPVLLGQNLQLKKRNELFFAGQISGMEGYSGSIATGLLAGVNAARFLNKSELMEFPFTSMTGALVHFITSSEMKDFQPMKANFGILPPLDPPVKNKKLRYSAYAERALKDLGDYLNMMEFSKI